MPIRRRRQDEEPAEGIGPDDEQAQDAAAETETDAEAPDGGPWDAEESYPEIERLDFGALRVPVGPGLGFQVNFEATEVDAEGNPLNGRPVAVLVQHAESVLQLQAFAAPKRAGIWDDIRRETAAEISGEQVQGQTQENDGPFGRELLAMVPAPLTEEVLAEMPAEVREQIPQEIVDQGFAWQPIRFIGVDGPRWFLQGVVQGAAIEDEEQWQVLEDVFRNIVVVRGEQPMPPRELLQLELPKEFSEATAEDTEGAEDTEDRGTFDPFERGPEITEVR